jgi:hypothetical protein
MSDRPAPPAKPPAPPRTPAGAPVPPPPSRQPGASTSKTQKTPKIAKGPAGPAPSAPPSQPSPSTSSSNGAQPGAEAGPGDTAVRVGLAERIQAKLNGSERTGKPAAETTVVTPGSATDGSAVGPDAAPVAAPAPSKKPRPRGPRRARLRLTRVDPWSVMKTAFLLSIAFGIVTVVAVAMIWQVIDAAGVWTSINDAINEVVTEPGNTPFDIEDYLGTDRVLGFTMLVAAVDVVLITAIATLGAFLYNMSAALLGGIEVTLAEDN